MNKLLIFKLESLPIHPYTLNIPAPSRSWTKMMKAILLNKLMLRKMTGNFLVWISWRHPLHQENFRWNTSKNM